MKIDILPLSEDYIKGITEVENNSFSIPWSEQSFRNELANDAANYYVALSDNKVIGYIGFWEVAGEGDITNVAVLPEYRRIGAGSLLIRHVISECRKRNLCRLTLEVRTSNFPARSLYEKYGFSEAGIRKNYYSDTREDAVIMELCIPDGKENQ